MAHLPHATVLRSTLRLWRRLAFSSNAASTPNRHGVLLFDGIPIFSPARRPSTTHTHTPHKWIGRGRWMHRGPERWIAMIVRISIQGKEIYLGLHSLRPQRRPNSQPRKIARENRITRNTVAYGIVWRCTAIRLHRVDAPKGAGALSPGKCSVGR